MKPTQRVAYSVLISMIAAWPIWAEEAESTIGPDSVDVAEREGR